MTTQPQLGVTYWPARKGLFFWETFDRHEVRHELAHVADLGGSTVRVFLPWETFQPWEHQINPRAFDAFGHLLDAAEDAGVGVVPVLFVGHLYGQRFLPGWLLRPAPAPDVSVRTVSGGREYLGQARPLYTTRPLLDAQRYLVHELIGFYAAHSAIRAWDVGGNGLVLVVPPAAPGALLEWAGELVQVVQEADGGRHPVWWSAPDDVLTAPNLPTLAELAEIGLLPVPETYPALRPEAQGPDDAEFVAFMWALVATLSARPLPCAITGLPTAPPQGPRTARLPTDSELPPRALPLHEEETQAVYLEQVLTRAANWHVDLIVAATFADAPPELWATPPFDHALLPRHSGLVRADGREKETATTVRLWAKGTETHVAAQESLSFRPLAVDPEELARRGWKAIAAWYRAFLEGEL
ncbi:MAG: hypothetical protein Q9O62_00355 [Ardenticatenia bacterium]|nr:hypothetical protein [Ardenticatenia bacterium]